MLQLSKLGGINQIPSASAKGKQTGKVCIESWRVKDRQGQSIESFGLLHLINSVSIQKIETAKRKVLLNDF